MAYERKERYALEEIFDRIGREDHIFDGDAIHMDSLRYQVFKRQPYCVVCGLKATHFYKERHMVKKAPAPGQNPERFHFNMYGVEISGNEVQFTKDHVLPKSKGGKDILENMQTMCFPCNQAKQNLVNGTPTEEEILTNAIGKNGMTKLVGMDQKTLMDFIRYVRNIGYSEGWVEGRRELKDELKRGKK